MRPSVLALVSAIALTTTAPLALAEESAPPASTAPIAAAPQAQPKGRALLEGVIGEVAEGRSDFAQMQPMLKVNLLQQKGLIPSLTTRLQSFGSLQSVSYAGLQRGMEIYDVRFAEASMVWAVGVDDEGKLARVFWRFR